MNILDAITHEITIDRAVIDAVRRALGIALTQNSVVVQDNAGALWVCADIYAESPQWQQVTPDTLSGQ